jgi:hypothetical protein
MGLGQEATPDILERLLGCCALDYSTAARPTEFAQCCTSWPRVGVRTAKSVALVVPRKAMPGRWPRRRMRVQSTGNLPMSRRACRHQLNEWSGGDPYQSTHTDDWGRPLIRTDEFVGERSPDAKQAGGLRHVEHWRYIWWCAPGQPRHGRVAPWRLYRVHVPGLDTGARTPVLCHRQPPRCSLPSMAFSRGRLKTGPIRATPIGNKFITTTAGPPLTRTSRGVPACRKTSSLCRFSS